MLADTVLMVRPAGFRFNAETASTNALMRDTGLPVAEQQRRALVEFDGVVQALRTAGIRVIIADDDAAQPNPDAVFPNNWVSFHRDDDGRRRVVLYPMESPSRRRERREEVLDAVRSAGVTVDEIIDLSALERDRVYLEGTGSLVLDRLQRVAYAARSPRTHDAALAAFAEAMAYDIVAFDAVDRDGVPYYHTNVLMMIGDGIAVVCAESIEDEAQRATVLSRLAAGGRVIVEITRPQVGCFAGNLLAVRDGSGVQKIICSRTAVDSLTADQCKTLSARGDLVIVDVPFIERTSGGGVRCMLAEVF